MKLFINIACAEEADTIPVTFPTLFREIEQARHLVPRVNTTLRVCFNGKEDGGRSALSRAWEADRLTRFPDIALEVVASEIPGKINAINLMMNRAGVENAIHVFVDADALLGRGSMAKVVRPLLEREVRCATCTLHPLPVVDETVAYKCMASLIERQVGKRYLHGALFALAGKSWCGPIPDWVVNDDYWIAEMLGWEFEKIPDASVFILPPETVLDYLTEVIRVKRGHGVHAKMTGKGREKTTVSLRPLALALARLTTVRRPYAAEDIRRAIRDLDTIARFVAETDGVPVKWRQARSTRKWERVDWTAFHQTNEAPGVVPVGPVAMT